MELSNLGVFILVAVIVLLLAAYALGIEHNVRKGHKAMGWIREGLPLVGEKTTLRWLGSSVVELKIEKAKDPFRNAEVLVVLEPRDVPFMWLITRRQGRRDMILFRAQLRAAPRFDLEAALPNAWNVNRHPNAEAKLSVVQGSVANNMRAEMRGDISLASINSLITRGAQSGTALMRLSVRRAVPNLEVHYRLPKESFDGAPGFFKNLRALSEMILDT